MRLGSGLFSRWWKMIKVPSFEDTQFGRECYISKRTESIREKLARVAQLEALETRQRVDIAHVEVDGEEMVLVSLDGREDGVAIAVADIESGALSLQDAVNELMDN